MGSPFNLRNGSMLLSTEAPGGIYNSTQLKKIAALSESNGAVIRATEDQRIALVVSSDKVAQVAKELKSTGLGIRHYQDGMHQPVSCIGEMCPDYLQDALGSAMDITKVLADITSNSPVKIGINGCASCCVPCHTYDISIIGDTNGYRVSLGGKNSQLPEMATFMAEGVPAKELPGLVRKIVELYKANAESGERLQEVMERVGTSSFVAALAPYSQDAAASDPFGSSDSPVSDEVKSESIDVADSLELDSDLMPLAEEAADDAADIVSDVNALGNELDESSEDTFAVGTEELGDLESMDDFAPSSIGDDLGVVDDIDPQGFSGGDLSVDVLIADDEPIGVIETKEEFELEELSDAAFEESSMSPAEAYESVATDDDALTMSGVEQLEGEELGEMESLDNLESIEDIAVEADNVATTTEEVANFEDDEDEIERKLNASIEETSSTPIEEDKNAADREAAADMLDSASPVEVDEISDEDLSNNEFSSLETSNIEMSGLDGQIGSELNDSELEYESVGADLRSTTSPDAPVASTIRTIAKANNSLSNSEWQVSSVDLTQDGKYVLQFSSGAELRVDPSSFSGSRQFSFGGKEITVSQVPNGTNIAVDGIEMFVPRRSAA